MLRVALQNFKYKIVLNKWLIDDFKICNYILNIIKVKILLNKLFSVLEYQNILDAMVDINTMLGRFLARNLF